MSSELKGYMLAKPGLISYSRSSVH